MNIKNFKSRDPDIINSFKALKRAAKAARKLSIETGTPFLIMRDGKIVDLNRVEKVRKTKPRRRRAASKTKSA